MATGSIVVNVLDVGQGQGTFVEIYDTSKKLTNTLLFDLGSAKSKKAAGGPSIKYIAEQIATMDIPKIDYLSLSHKDRDHVNLVSEMITEIEIELGPLIKLQIGQIRFGGAEGWYSSSFMSELRRYCPLDTKPFNLRHSSYTPGPPETWDAIWNKNEVYVYIVLANVPTDTTLTSWAQINVKNKPDSELANSVSIICTVWWNGIQCFINGDATFVTFQESNKIYEFTSFATTYMATLPHHGSRKSTFGLSASTDKASKEANAVVDKFAEKIKAKTITASAEIYGNYHHPSYDVIMLFQEYTDKGPAWYSEKMLLPTMTRHYISAFVDIGLVYPTTNPITKDYHSFETGINVYTTLYREPGKIGPFLAPPPDPNKKNMVGPGTTFLFPQSFPKGVQWAYTVDASGKITLVPKTNRDSSLLLPPPEQETPTRIFTRSKKVSTKECSKSLKAPAWNPNRLNLRSFR